MYAICDVLIPTRFVCFIIQILLSISIVFSYEDNIFNEVGKSTSKTSAAFKDRKKEFTICIVLLMIFEAFELVIIFSGYTLFSNRLSIAQIFFHSLTVFLINWYQYELWEIKDLWLGFAFGGLVPLLLEVFTFAKLYVVNRRISKIR